jgi:GntR family transcriptional regulator, transcriptional repressor for pyruvate dehydrogenase complex
MTFAPVARRSLADDVRRQLEARIRSGVLAPGAMLPSEEALGSELGVSRSSVREALRDVVALGLVERRGNRAHVVEHLPAVRLDDVRRDRIREVFETRRLIEVQLTEYAAARATPRQRRELAELAARIESARDLEELRPLDRAFHGTLSAAAGNDLLAELHAKVLDAVFAASPFDELLHGEADPGAARRVLLASARAHAAIARAVIAGDVTAAGGAARAHLDDVERRLAGERD